jgi:hypothetical protein
MVYAVPLTDGSYGIAQAGEAMWPNVIYVALFADRFLVLPETAPSLTRNSCIALVATWRQALNRGEWLSLGLVPDTYSKSEFPNEQFAQNGYIGARNYDAGVLSKFVSAYHGLFPWNVMLDPCFYDGILKPGVPRPSSLEILDEYSREKYRREILRVGA